MMRTIETAAQSSRGIQLSRWLRLVQRKANLPAFLLLAPLVVFLLLNFAGPVALVLFKSVDDREAGAALPRTAQALATWDRKDLPSEAAFKALVDDIREADKAKLVNAIGRRLNAAKPGFQALLGATARRLSSIQEGSFSEQLVALDPRWGQNEYWMKVQDVTEHPFTTIHLLATVDLTIDDQDKVVLVPESRRLFGLIWLRTLWMASVITVLCLFLGYPLAYFMTVVSPRFRAVVTLCVLLPFWTSLLVRTVAWVILLQDQGLVNKLGLFLGLWHERIQLIHNRLGVYVVMTHILLPFMVLPTYAVMRRISPTYMRAALSLGAKPANAFRTVYLPMTLPGVGAGCLFVFILSLGFYITPALVGGRNDQLISYFIAFFANETLNWNAAAALSAVLLALTILVFVVFNRVFRFGQMRMG